MIILVIEFFVFGRYWRLVLFYLLLLPSPFRGLSGVFVRLLLLGLLRHEFKKIWIATTAHFDIVTGNRGPFCMPGVKKNREQVKKLFSHRNFFENP